MSDSGFVRRRDVVLGVAAAILGGGSGGAIADEGIERAAEGIRSALGCVESATEIGRQYLTRYPAERGVKMLTELLGLEFLEQSTATEIRESLRAKIRMDFESGDCVSIEGWVLARSEARVCALVSLP